MALIKTHGPGLRIGMMLGDLVILDGEIEIQLIRDGGGKTRLRIYDPKRRTVHRRPKSMGSIYADSDEGGSED